MTAMAAKAKWRKKTVELTVVGLTYRITKPAMRELDQETPIRVKFVREYDNNMDENAIAVETDEDTVLFKGKIGYLRRQIAAVYAPAMDYGDLKLEEGSVTSIDAEAGTADVRITLRFRKSLEI
jgi:HIRAN domain